MKKYVKLYEEFANESKHSNRKDPYSILEYNGHSLLCIGLESEKFYFTDETGSIYETILDNVYSDPSALVASFIRPRKSEDDRLFISDPWDSQDLQRKSVVMYEMIPLLLPVDLLSMIFNKGVEVEELFSKIYLLYADYGKDILEFGIFIECSTYNNVQERDQIILTHQHDIIKKFVLKIQNDRECSNIMTIIVEYSMMNGIDIGISDDVKDIAGTALKGNHKLK